MLTLLKLSQKAGLVGTVLGVFVWLVIVAIVMDILGIALSQYNRLGALAMFGVAFLGCIGGLLGFSLVFVHVGYLWRGYRVKFVRGNHWVYEERGAKSGVPYVRELRRPGGYPEPFTIRILNAVAWETEAPDWAQGRRNEIVDRIVSSHGGNQRSAIWVHEEHEMSATAERTDEHVS